MSSRTLSRKAFLKLAGATTITGALAACQPAPQPPAPPAGATQAPAVKEPTKAPPPAAKKTIKHYLQGLTPRDRTADDRYDPPKYANTLKKQYEDAHPGVTVEFVPTLAQGYEEWLVTQMSGGTSPEIVWYQRGYIARDYQKGWFVNLDPFLAQPNPYVPNNKTWKEVFQAPCIESGKAPDGHIYMITGDLVGTGFFYNKTLFDKLGLKVPEIWKDFDAAQKAIKDAKVTPVSISMDLAGGVQLYGSWTTRIIQDVLYDKKMGMIKGTNQPVSRTWKPGENLQPPIMVKAILDKRYGATDPEWKEMLRIMKDWSKWWPDGFWAFPPGDVYRLWANGDAAMAWLGSWMNKPVRNDPLIKFEWGILPKIPKITQETSQFGGIDFPAMAGVGGVFQYAIAAAAEKRGVLNETIDWMRFITAPKQLIPLLNDHGGFAPGIVDTTGADPTLSVYTDMLVKFGAERIEPFDSMLTREFVDTMWNQLQQFLAGKVDTDGMANKMQGEMEKAAKQLAAEHPDWVK
jgi:raffinose/stachyose/melibiose transport system substrate-binding protein